MNPNSNPNSNPNPISAIDTRPIQQWPTFVVGKPGIDYSKFRAESQPTVLSWNIADRLKNDRPQLLIDCVKVAKQIKELEKWLEMVKEGLKDEYKGSLKEIGMSADLSIGNAKYATVSYRSRVGLDTEKIKAEMGDEWVNAHSKETEYYEVRWSGGK